MNCKHCGQPIELFIKPNKYIHVNTSDYIKCGKKASPQEEDLPLYLVDNS